MCLNNKIDGLTKKLVVVSNYYNATNWVDILNFYLPQWQGTGGANVNLSHRFSTQIVPLTKIQEKNLLFFHLF